MFDEYLIRLRTFFNSFKKFKFSFIFVPDTSRTNISSKTISFRNSVIIFLVYNILLLVLFSFLYKPISEFISPPEQYSEKEFKEIELLNERLNLLLMEVDHLKKLNNQLNMILQLSDSSTTQPKKTEVPKSTKNQITGNVTLAFELFLEKYIFQSDIFFKKPMNGFVSREFNSEKGHFGIDFAASIGTPLVAAANGYIVFADYTSNDGFMIIINHSNDYTTVYKHCSILFKNVREFVRQGETIALSGNTGKLTTGPHLHFEIWRDGVPLDPKTLFLNY
ncbi:MAG TPA: M23 family metallopeptidase [Ignavibacteriaceae bacterium]|mgnify:CR=1 FL=1|nr:M23 family metallopeptidase [Ignavibacteriaceae bacterium]